MDRASLIVAGFVALLFGSAIGPAAAQAPAITLTVDDEAVSAGETVRLRTNPTLGLEITAESAIEVAEIRVDGEIRRSYAPDSPTFSETVRLDLESGEHEIQVVANAGEVSTLRLTVLKDDLRPRVAYTSPFQTSRLAGAPDSVTLDEAAVSIAGDLHDDTGVAEVEIRHRYEYSGPMGGGTSRERYTIHDPGSSFAQDLLLGNGDNELTISYTDELGNLRQDEMILTVDDETPPTLDVDVPARSGASRIRVQGEVTDNVKINTVTVVRPDGTESTAVSQTSAEPDRERLSMTINQRVDLRRGSNTVTVRATDIEGNTATEDFQVEYDPNLEPRITFDQERITVEGGSVRVVARVDRGLLTTVTVETVRAGSGEIVDIAQVYSGDGTNRVEINETLSIADAETRIRVRAVTAGGEEFAKELAVSAAATPTETTTSPPPEDDDDSEEDTPTETSTPGFRAIHALLAVAALVLVSRRVRR